MRSCCPHGPWWRCRRARSLAPAVLPCRSSACSSYLRPARQNLGGLAAALDVAPSTATRMVDRLVDAGLVYRTIPAGDRREISLTLTPRGGAQCALSPNGVAETCDA